MNFGIVRVGSFLRRIFAYPHHQSPLARAYLSYLTFCLLTPLISRAQTDEFQFHSVGARAGFPAENTSNHFRQAEAFLNYNLWRWNLSTNWGLQSRLGVSAGWLGQHGDNAFVGNL